MLPTINEVKLPRLNFPTVWQAVIFRNYGYVATEKIATILDCSTDVVINEAKRLGLEKIAFNPKWEEKGYITIIRNNWYLLPYEQLLKLLGYSAEKLEFILKEEDFLSVKLGKSKPHCPPVKYIPLTQKQIAKTESLAKTVQLYYRNAKSNAFQFFEKKIDVGVQAPKKTEGKHKRIIHGYSVPCGNAFEMGSEVYLTDAELQQHADNGVNGIWIQGVLSVLSPYPFSPELSKDYQRNRENLKKLIERAKKYGINIYLYLNEPRGVSANIAKQIPELVGITKGENYSLCIETKEVQEYLYNSIKDLLSAVPELGGIITITMSENLTHCYSSGKKQGCEHCANTKAEEAAAKINNIVYKAIQDAKVDAELIANLWGWSTWMGWSEQQIMRGITLLEKGISIMCVSEAGLPVRKGDGVAKVIDYSISNVGPSEISAKMLTKARDTGHKIYAKIQANNSWECAVVPYLPVFDLIYEHLENLAKLEVQDYMLSWTLGGYPSITLDLVHDFSTENFTLEKWYSRHFGTDAQKVHQGVKEICDGFRELPYSISMLYYSPKNLGFANLSDLEEEEKKSLMVCYSFDDYQTWIEPYSYETYKGQMEKLLLHWNNGLQILKNIKRTPLIDKLILYAEIVYLHYQADILQTEFSYIKQQKDDKKLLEIIKEQRLFTYRLLELCNLDSCIAFEAANHYFYTDRNLLEKLIQLDELYENVSKN